MSKFCLALIIWTFYRTSDDISWYKKCYLANALRPTSFSYLDLYCADATMSFQAWFMIVTRGFKWVQIVWTDRNVLFPRWKWVGDKKGETWKVRDNQATTAFCVTPQGRPEKRYHKNVITKNGVFTGTGVVTRNGVSRDGVVTRNGVVRGNGVVESSNVVVEKERCCNSRRGFWKPRHFE